MAAGSKEVVCGQVGVDPVLRDRTLADWGTALRKVVEGEDTLGCKADDLEDTDADQVRVGRGNGRGNLLRVAQAGWGRAGNPDGEALAAVGGSWEGGASGAGVGVHGDSECEPQAVALR